MMLTSTHTNTYSLQSLLRIYALYRAILTALFIGTLHFSTAPFSSMLGGQNPAMFTVVAHSYGAIAVITLIRVYSDQYQPSDQHVFLVCFVDVVCITLLMHASGGMNSGLGLLLLITVSAASIILSSQIATLVAAMATLAILSSVTSQLLSTRGGLNNLLPAGLLGFLLFASSQLFLYLTKRIRISSEEVEIQARHREEAQQLNELIVKRMRTGLVVLAPDGKIRLMNQSAARLLDLPLSIDSDFAIDVSFAEIPALYQSWQRWRHSPQTRQDPLQLRSGGPEVQLSFAGLEQSDSTDTLVFVEDSREIAQQAQQLKLASLGHLTASIAHEIRNPLGAISHAAQLLAESGNIDQKDARLSEIIQDHSLRVNQIIENVLQLSRRDKPKPERIQLNDYLNDLVTRYKQSHSRDIDIQIQSQDTGLEINIDGSQLEQVLINLMDNGLRYSLEKTGKATLLLQANLDETLDIPCLNIIDEGDGISDEHIEKLFEPFFTTESTGTGLGLYIAREICAANQAQLDYIRTPEGKSCFRIRFSHPEKSVANQDAS